MFKRLAIVTITVIGMVIGSANLVDARAKHLVTIPSCTWRPAYGPSSYGTCVDTHDAQGNAVWGVTLHYADGTVSPAFRPSQYKAWWAEDFTLWFDMKSLSPRPQDAPSGVDY